MPKESPSRVADTIVGIIMIAGLLAPLVFGFLPVRLLSASVAFVGALFILTAASRARRKLQAHADYGRPTPIAKLTIGEIVTVRGVVTSEATVESPTSKDRFALGVATLHEQWALQEKVLLSRPLANEIEIADSSGTATVRVDRLALFARTPRTLRWTGYGAEPVPASLREWLPERVLEEVERPEPQGDRGGRPVFEYRELVVDRGDEVVLRGEVVALDEHLDAGTGYRSSAVRAHAVIGPPDGEALRMRALPAERVELHRRAARRNIALGIVLAAWAVAVLVVPSIYG